MIYSIFKKLIPLSFLAMAMIGIHPDASADVANPNLRKTVTLENGETVTMRLVGDEYGHFWQDVKSETVYSFNTQTQTWNRSKESGKAILRKAAQRRDKEYSSGPRKRNINKSLLT